MRFLFPIIASLLFAGCSEPSSDLSQQLLTKHWFVHGQFWEQEHKATLSNDSISKFEWSAVFYPGGKMKYSSFITQSYTDTSGVFHPSGERFTDHDYSYEIKNNILKVTKRNDSYYLLLVPKADSTFDIISMKESEFK
ncbi:MAG: hypothetical protein K0S32_1733 [Bacteroidetes bacterium]|jgi:hypothetical protein|nr:hypothetical protein [Bacteroidota bacterium]